MVRDFVAFIEKQGVVGLAIGFILGGAITKLVTALVDDLVNPVLGVALGAAGSLSDAKLRIGPAEIAWGHLVNSFIDFLVIAWIVYLGIKWLRLEDKEAKKKN